MRAGSSSAASRADAYRQSVATTLDAGEANCAVLILNVRDALTPLPAGAILEIIAWDPSVQLDLRAWCSMTRHHYLGMSDYGAYAAYYVRKRGTPNGEDTGLR